jgi:hypothetical protein
MESEVEQGQAASVTITDGQSTGKRRPGANGGSIVAPWSSEDARAAARRRWDNMSKAARLGIADAGAQIPDIDKRSAPDVIRYLAQQHTLNAADPSARGATQSFKIVTDLAYPKPEREVNQANAVPAGGATLALSPELARELLAAMRERRANQANAE